MGLIDREIEVSLGGSNIKYYENLGYKIPKYYDNRKKKEVVKRGTKILINIKDLNKFSSLKVNVKCDNPNCKKNEYKVSYAIYIKCNRNGKYYCKDCAMKLFNSGENNSNYNSWNNKD